MRYTRENIEELDRMAEELDSTTQSKRKARVVVESEEDKLARKMVLQV